MRLAHGETLEDGPQGVGTEAPPDVEDVGLEERVLERRLVLALVGRRQENAAESQARWRTSP